MSEEHAVSSSGIPALVVRTGGSDRTLRAGRSYRVGRDPQSDIVVDEPRISWLHAILRVEGDRWLLEDVGSTNGIFVGPELVERVEITGPCQVRLGHPESGPVISCSIAAAPDGQTTLRASAGVLQPTQQSAMGERRPTAVMRLPAKVLRIGRADDNDVVVSDLSVSRHHAELRRAAGGGYEIVDLASYNGTFVNGQRVVSAGVSESDVIGVGLAAFRLVGDELQQFIDTGDVSLDARGLTVRLPGGKVILDDVSFPLGERCLLEKDAVTAARDRYQLPERFILAVGAHRPHKNYDVLVRAMRQVPSSVSLVIVGYLDPNFRERIPRLITELGLQSRVHLVPSVDDELLPAVYRAASVFALPSLAEGFGLPVLEAMAVGTPVVASAIPVLEEVCSAAATLVPARDPAAWASALTAALENKSSVAALVAAGAEVAAAATWDRGGLALRELLTCVARGEA